MNRGDPVPFGLGGNSRGVQRQPRRPRPPCDRVFACEAGSALIVVILLMPILMALGATLATVVTMDMRLRGGFQRSTSGFYAAESGVDRAMAEYRNIFLDFRVPGGSDFAARSFTLGNRSVAYQLTEVPGNPKVVTIPVGDVFGGLSSLEYTYTVSSEAESSNETEASIGAEFDVSYIPLFQFAAFYTNDLEILPGPEMHLHGRVHTNGNLYLNAGTHLYIEDNPGAGITAVQVSAKGHIYRGRKDTSDCQGPVTVDMLGDVSPPTPDLDPQDLTCNGSGTRKVSTAELATWKGSMVSEIESISVPEPDIIEKGEGVFWEKADLRIALKLNQAAKLGAGPMLPHAIEVQDASGTRDVPRTALLQAFMMDAAYNTGFSSMPTTLPIFYTDVPANACASTSAACYTPALASDARVYATNNFDLDYRRGGFYNQREKKWIYLLNINLHDLLDWNQRQGAGNRLFEPDDASDGGVVIYASVDGPDSGGIDNYGVRIFGSAQLVFPASVDPTGLTFATDQAVYVLGNYNSVARQPAAVMGDSLNVLSNKYFNNNACGNDCQSNLPLGNAARAGATTTINTAFLGGVDTTTPGHYNGGLENYPRFHESWGSAAWLNYRGSFVSLGTPQHVNGAWCGTGSTCNIYNPPARNYDYEPAFNDAKNLPPLTPRFLYLQQVLFTQDFR